MFFDFLPVFAKHFQRLKEADVLFTRPASVLGLAVIVVVVFYPRDVLALALFVVFLLGLLRALFFFLNDSVMFVGSLACDEAILLVRHLVLTVFGRRVLLHQEPSG